MCSSALQPGLTQLQFRLSNLLCFLVVFLARSGTAEEFPAPRNVICRSDFQNSRIQFEREKSGHVAFIGGSITEMDGYRPMVMNVLQKRFPETEFQFTDAGISSTCSTAGAFRLPTDVLSQGNVDLFFIEFAVNDDQDAGHSLEYAIRGMEGILAQTRSHSPYADIAVTYFVNPGMLEKLQRGETPVSMAAHQQVADRYNVTVINLAQEVADRIDNGTLTWKQYGGVHPAPAGNAIPAKMIEKTLEMAWSKPLLDSAKRSAKPLPEMVDELSYKNGRYLSADVIQLGEGWHRMTPDWPNIAGSVRERHRTKKMFVCNRAGAELSFAFDGSAVGVECLAGPDAGTLEYSIDDGDWSTFNLAHHYSKGLHYPRTVVFEDDLVDKAHRIRVRLKDQNSDYGHAPVARILNFVVN